MLQCLCGRSLKKDKNPTGEFVARVRAFRAFHFVACLCARAGVCARPEAAAVRLLFLCNRRCASSECTKGREGGRGGGEQEGDNLLAQNMSGVACVRGVSACVVCVYSRDAAENQV